MNIEKRSAHKNKVLDRLAKSLHPALQFFTRNHYAVDNGGRIFWATHSKCVSLGIRGILEFEEFSNIWQSDVDLECAHWAKKIMKEDGSLADDVKDFLDKIQAAREACFYGLQYYNNGTKHGVGGRFGYRYLGAVPIGVPIVTGSGMISWRDNHVPDAVEISFYDIAAIKAADVKGELFPKVYNFKAIVPIKDNTILDANSSSLPHLTGALFADYTRKMSERIIESRRVKADSVDSIAQRIKDMSTEQIVAFLNSRPRALEQFQKFLK